MEASGIILAGGNSSRMGRDKSLLKYNHQTLIELTVKELQKVVEDIIIASNHTSKYNIPGITEVPDLYPGTGPLAGMHSGLQHIKHRYAFIVSCDMPLFSADLAKYLLELSPGYDVVVPNINGYQEPLCAVYSKKCIDIIEGCLKAGVNKITRIFSQVRVLQVGHEQIKKIGNPDEIFYNLNTPEDYSLLMNRRCI